MSDLHFGRRDFLKLTSSGTLSLYLSRLRLDRVLAPYTPLIPTMENSHVFLGNMLAPEPQTSFPSLAEFIMQIKSRDRVVTSKKIDGVWSKDVTLAATVVNQPAGKPDYVSENQGELTHFSVPDAYGDVLGLLAHNNLDVGKSITKMQIGHKLTLIAKSGILLNYQVREVYNYRAHDPKNLSSDFSEVGNESITLSASELFHKVYTGEHHVTFQTCIEKNGDNYWGRRFVLAYPLTQ